MTCCQNPPPILADETDSKNNDIAVSVKRSCIAKSTISECGT